jgi:hypothetical protein
MMPFLLEPAAQPRGCGCTRRLTAIDRSVSNASPTASNVWQRIAIRLSAIALAVLLTQPVTAQSSAQRPAARAPLGTWRGTSVCLVRPSACNDEVVIYRISPMRGSDSVSLDARKIVRGEEEEMGVLACRLTAPQGPLTCAIPRGIWQFRVRNDSLAGELRLSDGTRFRDVRAVRAP